VNHLLSPSFAFNNYYTHITSFSRESLNDIKNVRFRIGFGGLEISIGDLNYTPLPVLLHYFQNDFQTKAYIEKINQPVLFIYGGKDEYLGIHNNRPDSDIYDLYHSCPSPNKSLYVIRDTTHGISRESASNLEFLDMMEKEQVVDEASRFFIRYLP
jgi:pimeloyl-ACP methyl ester carboxylesterase